MGHDEYTLDPEQMAKAVPDIEPTPEQMAAVRKYLSPDCQHVDDATVRRFIRATGGDIDLSIKRLEATTRWQAEVKPETMVCTACAKDPKAHYMHVSAFDKAQRPVIYSCLEMASNKNYDDNREHMLQTFETALKCMRPGVEQWVWVCDFHGFGMSDVSPKLAKAFLSISADNYPERLALFIIVDAPKLFAVLWKAVKSFLDPKTYRKIRFVSYDPEPKKGESELRAALYEAFDGETAEWFMREMADNRGKKAAKEKTYNYAELHKSASAGRLPRLDMSAPHDPRGTPALLEFFAANPQVLLPQAAAAVAGK